jgi:hypothetical protein
MDNKAKEHMHTTDLNVDNEKQFMVSLRWIEFRYIVLDFYS